MMEIMKKDCGYLLQYFAHDHLSNQRQDEGFNRLLKMGGENYKNSRSKLSKTVRIRYRPYILDFSCKRSLEIILYSLFVGRASRTRPKAV